MHACLYPPLLPYSAPPPPKVPSLRACVTFVMAHCLNNFLLPQASNSNFPHEPPYLFLFRMGHELTSARSLSRTGASPERTNVEGKWSTRGWRGVMKQGGCWWGHLWRAGWHGDDGLQ